MGLHNIREHSEYIVHSNMLCEGSELYGRVSIQGFPQN